MEAFPQIPIRFGRKTLNPKLKTAIVHIQSTYEVSDHDVMGTCVDLANMIFGQNWIKENESDVESDDDDTGFEEEDNGKPEDDTQTPTIKRRKLHRDLTYRFPSRATRWFRQRALLNLRYVADQIKGKDPSEVITLVFDDTTKAAGVRLYGAKTNNITIKGDDTEKKSFTAGFSHSGYDQAETLLYKKNTCSSCRRRTFCG